MQSLANGDLTVLINALIQFRQCKASDCVRFIGLNHSSQQVVAVAVKNVVVGVSFHLNLSPK